MILPEWMRGRAIPVHVPVCVVLMFMFTRSRCEAGLSPTISRHSQLSVSQKNPYLIDANELMKAMQDDFHKLVNILYHLSESNSAAGMWRGRSAGRFSNHKSSP